MNRKVFISFLGTNNYVETYYSFPDNERSAPVRFIQEAIIVKNCANWTDNDRIIIFCTEKAELTNWKDSADGERIGLEHRLRLTFECPEIIEMVHIPDGFSESELWEIFNIVDSKLIDGDLIYFDVTHAFRYLPLFSSVLFNYTRFIKHTAVVSVLYGAFEKLGAAYEVREMPIEQRIAPVLDLTPLISLEQFTDMANSLKNYGRMDCIGKTLDEYEQIRPSSIKQMKRGIEEFDNYILTNRMGKIREGTWMATISNAIKDVRRAAIPSAMKKILEELERELKNFEPKATDANIEAAIQWAVHYHMLPSAYTIGQEYIISLVADRIADRNPFNSESLTTSEKNKKFRQYISALCGIKNNIIEKKEFTGDLKEYEELTMELLQLQFIKNLRMYYQPLANNRNALNHARNSDKEYAEFENDFVKSYDGCISVIKNLNTDQEQSI